MSLHTTQHTVVKNSAFSSEASCFLMKVRTAWTASGSATSIMSIISPSPGRVIAFAINSWIRKYNSSWLVHSSSSTTTTPPKSDMNRKPSSYFVQAWITKHTSEAMHKLWIQNQWFVLLEISHQAEHQFPCQHLSSFPTKKKRRSLNSAWTTQRQIKESINVSAKTNRLNSSESLARRKNRSLSERSDSRRIGAL